MNDRASYRKGLFRFQSLAQVNPDCLGYLECELALKRDLYYTKSSTITSTSSTSNTLSASYLSLKAAISQATSQVTSGTIERVLPPQLTLQRLVDYLGSARCLWVIEDFHKIPSAEKLLLAQALKVFVDASMEHKDMKVVAIGDVDTAREVIEYNPEMRNRVAEIHVPLMSHQEIREIIAKGEEALNCKFSSKHKDTIAELSSGLGSIYHQLCLNTCLAADLYVTSESIFCFSHEHIQTALEMYLADSSDTLKSTYDKAVLQKKAGQFDNCRIIVNFMASIESDRVTHNVILTKIRFRHPKYPSGNLTMYLKELQTTRRGEILRYDSTSGLYSFSSPFLPCLRQD